MAKTESLPFSVVEFKRQQDKASFDSLGEKIIDLQREIESRTNKIESLKLEMEKISKRNDLPKAFHSNVWRYNYVTSVRERLNKIKLLEAGVKSSIINKCTDHSVASYIRISSTEEKDKEESQGHGER